MSEVALEYLAIDPDFQWFLEYLQSPYIGCLVSDIRNIPAVTNFLHYLQKSGLDIYKFLNKLHKILNQELILQQGKNFIQITGGLPGFIKDTITALPMKKVKKLYNEKLQNSLALKDLLEQIQTADFQKFIATIIINKRLYDLKIKVDAKCVNVDSILKTINQLLGIRLSRRQKISPFVNEALKKDLKEFAALVPRKKIAKIVIKYSLDDKDFKRVIKYIKSNDFYKLFKNVEATKEMKQFLDFLNSIGLDVHKWIKVFHKIIGMGKIEIEYYSTSRKISGGINGLIKDIKAILPIKELYTLYQEKLKGSAVFAEFVVQLRSQEFQNLVNALAKIDDVERVLTKLESMNVDVNRIFQFLYNYFGIKFPPRPRHSNIH